MKVVIERASDDYRFQIEETWILSDLIDKLLKTENFNGFGPPSVIVSHVCDQFVKEHPEAKDCKYSVMIYDEYIE